MADKTLLILGNGFDKAHILKSTGKSLPTGYTDFLDYVEEKHKTAFNTIYGKRFDIDVTGIDSVHHGSNFDLSIRQPHLAKAIDAAINNKNDNVAYEKVNQYIEKNTNFWLLLFHQRRKEIGDLWMDFESEIAQIISFLEQYMIHEEKDIPEKYAYLKQLLPLRKKLSAENIQIYLVPHLEMDLKHLILLLEEYLLTNIDALGIRNLSGAPKFLYEQKNIEAIISYNYTHIFEHIYFDEFKRKPSFPIFYIHGELGRHNLVLGTGETLEEQDIPSMVCCNSFKKYFQTIYYRLDTKYQDKFSDYGIDKEVERKKDPLATRFAIDEPSPEYNLIIYGHSLDVTDKDSLKAMMVNELTDKITIYYYDNDALKRQIMNAIQILGKNRMIKWVSQGKLRFQSIST